MLGYHYIGSGADSNGIYCSAPGTMGAWQDPDGEVVLGRESSCTGGGHKAVFAGEIPVGEYDSISKKECCGDDDGEYSHFQDAYFVTNDASVGFGDDTDNYVCCNAASDCVFNKVCHTTGAKYYVNSENAYCDKGTDGRGNWKDCDYNSDICNSRCSYGIHGYIKAGEIGVGEYPNTETDRCCGDDLNEARQTMKCLDSSVCEPSSGYVCCTSTSDCVYNNACYANGAAVNVDADVTVEVCSSGTWTNPTCAVNGAYCDVSAGDYPVCCEGLCQHMDRQFIPPPEGNPVLYSRCAASSTDCVDEIFPYVRTSGTVYSGMLCCNGQIFRCSLSPNDVCQKECGYTCIEASSGPISLCENAFEIAL